MSWGRFGGKRREWNGGDRNPHGAHPNNAMALDTMHPAPEHIHRPSSSSACPRGSPGAREGGAGGTGDVGRVRGVREEGVNRREVGLGRVIALALEFLVLFGAGPALWFEGFVRPNLFVVLIGFAGISLLVLRRDREFDRGRIFNLAGARAGLGRVLGRFVVLGVLLTGVVWALAPEQLFILVKRNPGLWAAIMLLYPIFSVYPQEMIYRTFLFHRYRELFPGKYAMIAASAVAFGFGHVILHNPLAVMLTVVGGALFASTYERSRSTFLAVVEHALYGNLVFTIGLGASFYLGALR